MVEWSGCRCLWKSASVAASIGARIYFFRLSRVVDPRIGRPVLSSRSGRPFPRVSHARNRVRAACDLRRPPLAEMHCPFAIARVTRKSHGAVAIHRRRPPMQRYRCQVSAKESREVKCARAREVRRSVSSRCVAVLREMERRRLLTNCSLIRVFARINHSAVSVSPLHSTARHNCRILGHNCDRALHHHRELRDEPSPAPNLRLKVARQSILRDVNITAVANTCCQCDFCMFGSVILTRLVY